MKKFLSIILTLCLMLTLVAVPLPAMAETTTKQVFDFENYSPSKYIAMSGRVAPFVEDNGNAVVMFNNNGIPYRSADIDKTTSFTKSGSTYTKAEATAIEAALAADPNAYANYYHYSAQVAVFKSNKAPYNNAEMYNAIELCKLQTSTTYKITINYKRENLVNALYVHPVSWDKQANQRPNLYVYDARITIPTTDTADSEYVTVSTVITTPEAFNTSGDNGKYVGDILRLVLYTGEVDANNVVYFDNITVEEVIPSNLTYHYADGTTKVVGDFAAGDTIDYAELAPNKMGDNGGVWYLDAQGTIPAPATMAQGGLDVYEVVKTGVFDFNNYYRFQGYTGNSFGINDAAVKNSIYTDGNGNIIVDTTKYDAATNQAPGALRKYVIAIGEAKAATKYKITVEYSYTATNADQRLELTPLTGYGTLTYTGVTDGSAAIKMGSSVELPQGTNQTIDLFFTAADNFSVNEVSGKAPIGEVANSFYLNVTTTEDGQAEGDNAVLATISKVTVVEYVDPAQSCTVTLNRGGVTEEVQVEKGKEFTLPDTEFTDTSWWNHATASTSARFVGYEGEKVVVNGDVTYYTTETYSYGQAVDLGYKPLQNIYRCWTGIDTTTENFSYLYKSESNDASSEWVYSGGYRVCTRLGVVEDGKTYRISVTYKATTDADITFHMLTTSVGNSGATTRNYLENGKAFYTVSGNTDGWTTAIFYITADLPAKVTESTNGLDDTKAFTGDALYLNLGKAAGKHNVEFAIKETKVEELGNVIEAKGASVLKDEKVVNGAQAIRYYYDYATATDGTTITIGDNEYDVVERGFIYANGAITHYAKENVNEGYNGYYIYSNGNATYGFTSEHFMMWLAKAKHSTGKGKLTAKSITGNDLAKKWNLEDGTLTFSAYITDIPESAYNAKFMVRGYVIFEDEKGAEHIIYSKTTNRSVQGIIDALAERH